MSTPKNPASLADWRRIVATMYNNVRQAPAGQHEQAWHQFRATKDALYRDHNQSPLNVEQLKRFQQLPYFEYDPTMRVSGRLVTNIAPEPIEVPLPEGTLRYTRVGYAHFELTQMPYTLALYWLNGYGGGLFLPFKDKTTGHETYGGGRYLYDTIKGADLGVGTNEIVLDFNYAYNPSCSYNDLWICPLSPDENRLPVRIPAGEKQFS